MNVKRVLAVSVLLGVIIWLSTWGISGSLLVGLFIGTFAAVLFFGLRFLEDFLESEAASVLGVKTETPKKKC